MKKSELRKLIREEIQKLSEESIKFNSGEKSGKDWIRRYLIK